MIRNPISLFAIILNYISFWALFSVSLSLSESAANPFFAQNNKFVTIITTMVRIIMLLMVVYSTETHYNSTFWNNNNMNDTNYPKKVLSDTRAFL